MQPVEALKGVSTQSQLLDSLKVYLNNKNRLQPIIGLGSLIECVKAGTHREALYLCEVCACRVSKADIRNHIMGSLHRYNYIKIWHPHLVSDWKENSDLSKLAWPLMEKAKILEGTEGPGDVHLLEVEDAVYQRMATCSENDAVYLINILRDGQGKPGSHSELEPEQSPVQSSRIVLLARNQQRSSRTSISSSEDTNKPPSLISEGWLNNTSTSLSDDAQVSPEPPLLSENSNSPLDDYTGGKPLIGLFRVVECRSEAGHTYCFLCHCCRIRSNKKDIIDHLTSSSHLMNYLMETHPEQVDVITADINDNCQLLQSLAREVEQDEGRGELKVVNAPELLCIQLTGKSYHWCIKMLCNGWTHTNIQKTRMAPKGLTVVKTSNQGMPEKCAVVMNITSKRRKKRKPKNTVFKVSLPITKGSVLLERTSFTVDSLPVASGYLPPSDSDLTPPPESQAEECEFDRDTADNLAELTSEELQQDLYSGDAEAGQYMGPERNCACYYQKADGYFNDNEYFNQSESRTWTNDPRIYGENNDNRECGSQERSSETFEGPQTQNNWLSPAVSHIQDWPAYNSSYGRGEGCTEQWYSSTSQNRVDTRAAESRVERQSEMSSDAMQYYCQQQPQDQYMAQNHTSLVTGSVGQHGSSGELAPHVGASWVNMHPHVGGSLSHSGNIAPVPRVQFLQYEQRPWQTYMGFSIGHVQTAPQSYMMQPTAQQAMQVGQGVMSDPNHNTGPVENPDQQFPHPAVIWSSR
ncbi:uncharacterized protein [Pagrus major]|uniref:uncharacterized protein n=1 Tax=Pagrus major TaxID=143350 RepID=UPI003CC83A3C